MSFEDERPLLIVGASRSGTTLLRLLLNSHPRIAVPHEFKYFDQFARFARPGKWKQQLDESTFTGIVDQFLSDREHVFDEVGLDNVRRQIMDQSDRSLAAPYTVAARAWMTHYGKSRWGEKTPYHIHYADVLIEMFPQARFLYMLRDPRAAVNSMNSVEYFSEDTVLNALNWNRSATVGYKTLSDAVPSDQLMVLRYEDLAADAPAVLTKVCDFIGEDFEPGMLQFYRDSKRFMAPEIKTENVTKAVTDTSIERWRKDLDEGDIRSIELVCRETMLRYGYEPVGGKASIAERLNVAIKRRYFENKIRQHSQKRGYTVAYPMFARFRRPK